MIKVGLELQPCVKQRSGIGVYTYEIIKHLNNSKLISYYGNVFNFLNRNDIHSDLEVLNFKINTNILMPYGVYRRIWNFIPISYNSIFKENVDITHFFNYIVPPKVKGKVILSLYDMAYLKFPETLDPKNLKRILAGIDYSIRRSDHIITISENSKKEILEHFNIPQNKISIVSPATSIPENIIFTDEIYSKFNIINDEFILYMGNLEPRKNIPRLIQAFYELKTKYNFSKKLVITGAKSWLYESIFETVRNLNLQEDIIFTGFVSEKEKFSLYKATSLFVYPSLYEGFGIPILEAMSVGTPVVCSNTSSMPEVGGEAAFYINPLDVNDIANGINTVLSNPFLQDSMIQKGYEQIKKFSWDESAKKLEQIYLNI